MPKISDVNLERVFMALPRKFDWVCECHKHDLPPFTGEIHGMSQALNSKNIKQRIFWWTVVLICITGGTSMVVMVILEYIQGPTATSTTIRLVNSLELPGIIICPKTPDSFNFTLLYNDVQHMLPNISTTQATDLIVFWIAGSGLENMNDLPTWNDTYLEYLQGLYKIWSKGYDHQGFFDKIQSKYGYKCEDLFAQCVVGGTTQDCCNVLFKRQVVPRRGICYQTKRNVNQTEADDIGRLVINLKAPSSLTSPESNYTQAQMIVYITDNFEYVTDFPRYYLYPFQYNRMHFTARYIDLLPSKDCTTKFFGKDTECFVKNWLFLNIILPYNCTVPYLNPPYLKTIKEIPVGTPICEPIVIAKDYYDKIQLVHSGTFGYTSNDCIPGCSRWDYSTTLQQGDALSPFDGYTFNLEISYYDLQYEYLQEVMTSTIPGLMSQIGGQFGFFLGLSIITTIQVTIFLARTAAKRIHNFFQNRKIKEYPISDSVAESDHRKLED
uniref:Uncharacterized protein n=1 Tax=Acrobeloides nanus TaxID=290746 RepID=A0A914ENI2_9BILA